MPGPSPGMTNRNGAKPPRLAVMLSTACALAGCAQRIVLMPWSIAGGAGMASPAAESLHLMAGRIAGGAGLAWLAATLLHHVPGRLAGRGTLREGDCGRPENETRSRNDRDDSGAHRVPPVVSVPPKQKRHSGSGVPSKPMVPITLRMVAGSSLRLKHHQRGDHHRAAKTLQRRDHLAEH